MACYEYKGVKYTEEELKSVLQKEQPKTRRILEVQSDLFQKGRGNKNLVTPQSGGILLPKSRFTKVSEKEYLEAEQKGKETFGPGTKEFGYSRTYEYGNKIYTEIDTDEYGYLDKSQDDASKENQFLQLLNKKNNWVTFFVKSIIQNSAKKRYEKVLFPKGDTAAKIQGHQTLEEFKKQKEYRIEKLKEKKEKLEFTKNNPQSKYIDQVLVFQLSKELGYIKDGYAVFANKDSYFKRDGSDVEYINRYGRRRKLHYIKLPEKQKKRFRTNQKAIIEKIDNEIKELKQEIINVESGQTQLSSIAKFYEETVTNILKKQGYNPVEIADDYGNKWNEITITPEQANETIFFELEGTEQNNLSDKLKSEFLTLANKLGISVESMQRYAELHELRTGKKLDDAVQAVADLGRKVIYADNANSLPEEIAHFTVASMENTRAFNRAMRLVERHPMYEQYFETYLRKYNGNEYKAKMEILGKIMSNELTLRMKEPKAGLLRWLYRMLRKVREFFFADGMEKFISKGVDLTMTGNLDLDNLKGLFNELSDHQTIADKLLRDLKNAEKYFKKYFTTGKEQQAGAIAAKLRAEYEMKLKAGEATSGMFRLMKFMVSGLNSLRKEQKERTRKLSYIRDFLDFYEPMVLQLQNYFEQEGDIAKIMNLDLGDDRFVLDSNKVHPENKDFYAEYEILNAKEALMKMVGEYAEVRRWYKNEALKAAKEYYKKEVKENLTDVELIKQEQEAVDKAFTSVDYDSSPLLKLFGSLMHSKDVIPRLIYNKVKELRNIVADNVYRQAENIFDQVDTNKINFSNLIEQRDEQVEKELTKAREKLAELKSRKVKFVEEDQYVITDRKGKQVINKTYTTRTEAHEKMREDIKEQKRKVDQLDIPLNYVSKVNNAKWESAFKVMRDKMHKKYGLSDDFEIRMQQKEDMSETDLAEYNKEWAKWFTKHTEPVSNLNEIIEARKEEYGGVNSPKFKAWKNRNMTKRADGTYYYKGELVRPSTGKTKTVGIGRYKKRVKTVDYSSSQYDKLNEEEKKLLNLLKNLKAQADSFLPNKTNPNRLPQIRADYINALLKKGDVRGFFRNMGDFSIDSDDVEFGGDPITRPDGSLARSVPTHFINKLNNSKDVSYDLIMSTLMYYKMANEFKVLSTNSAMFEAALDMLGERQVVTNAKEPKKGVESEVYKSLKNFIEMHVYGLQRDKAEITIGDKTIQVGKILTRFNNFIRNNNLLFRLSTALTGTLTSGANVLVETLVGRYVDKKTYARAAEIYTKYMPATFKEMGNPIKKTKMALMLSQHRALQEIEQQFSRLDFNNPKVRQIAQSGGYFPYEIGDHFVKGRLAISIMLSYVYDTDTNTFVQRSEMKRKGKNPDDYQTYWDLMEVKDGKLVANHKDKNIKHNLQKKIEYLTNRIDQRLSREDRAQIHRGAATQLLATHRSWISTGVQERFKPGAVNYSTGQMEEGYYLTAFNFMRDVFFSPERVRSLKELIYKFNTLEDWQKAGVKRTLVEYGIVTATTVLAVVLNKIAGDDEEDTWPIQFAAYIANRTLLELTAFQTLPILTPGLTEDNKFTPTITPGPLVGLTQTMEILQSPIAGIHQLNTLMDFAHIFSGEEIERGKFEGLTKRERFLINMTPGIKGIYAERNPKSTNQYIKVRAMDWLFRVFPLIFIIFV